MSQSWGRNFERSVEKQSPCWDLCSLNCMLVPITNPAVYQCILISGIPCYFFERLYLRETPDVICHALRFCYTQPGEKQCRLFPEPKVCFRNWPFPKWFSVTSRKLIPNFYSFTGWHSKQIGESASHHQQTSTQSKSATAATCMPSALNMCGMILILLPCLT